MVVVDLPTLAKRHSLAKSRPCSKIWLVASFTAEPAAILLRLLLTAEPAAILLKLLLTAAIGGSL